PDEVSRHVRPEGRSKCGAWEGACHGPSAPSPPGSARRSVVSRAHPRSRRVASPCRGGGTYGGPRPRSWEGESRMRAPPSTAGRSLVTALCCVATVAAWVRPAVADRSGSAFAARTYVEGVDVSHYQGTIDWSQVA